MLGSCLGTIAYLKTLLKDRDVASVTPSSKYAVKRVLDRISFDTCQIIVEYGPGLGVFTAEILKRMSENCLLITIEKNQKFVEKLELNFNDSRLKVISGSAEEILEHVKEKSVDAVVSGIPFSLIDPFCREKILQNTAKALKSDGRFLTYQVFPPPASMDKFLRKPLEKEFELLEREYEFRNVPPLRIYESKPLSLHRNGRK
jgi:phospholipid N-methyltransferase